MRRMTWHDASRYALESGKYRSGVAGKGLVLLPHGGVVWGGGPVLR